MIYLRISYVYKDELWIQDTSELDIFTCFVDNLFYN